MIYIRSSLLVDTFSGLNEGWATRGSETTETSFEKCLDRVVKGSDVSVDFAEKSGACKVLFKGSVSSATNSRWDAYLLK